MIADLLSSPAVHIGAGSLGRGLVVPVLVANGAEVVVVDTDAALVARLAVEGGYDLRIRGRGERIHLAGALHVDDPALPALLRRTRLVTTSVKQPNLPRVAALLGRCWDTTPDIPRVVVGCENVEHVGREIAAMLATAGVLGGIVSPDCVVDRVCAARWPDGLAVETEDYLEWSIEGAALSGIRLAEAVPDVKPRFTRKRYLVNTYADAMAFLGERQGYVMLHEAADDDALMRRIEPLMAVLRHLLQVRDGFDADGLMAYQRTARARLGNVMIGRRLTTVARDLMRKMMPAERFMEPIADLIARGEDARAAIDVVAAILDDPVRDRMATLTALRTAWAGHGWAAAVLDQIDEVWHGRK